MILTQKNFVFSYSWIRKYFSQEFIFANWAVWKISLKIIFPNWEEKFRNLCIFIFSMPFSCPIPHLKFAEQCIRMYIKPITLMSEIFAGRNFRESANSRNFLHFAGIYFRELKGNFFSRELIFANWEEKFLNLCFFMNFFYFNLSQITQNSFSWIKKYFSRE